MDELILRLAREAGMIAFEVSADKTSLRQWGRFAVLFAEECAKVCEARMSGHRVEQITQVRSVMDIEAQGCADMIRARFSTARESDSNA